MPYLYTYDHLRSDLPRLHILCHPFGAEAILAIARGGLSLAHALAMALQIRSIQSVRVQSYDEMTQRETLTLDETYDLSPFARVLIVDDIIDSGQTLAYLMERLRARYPQITFASVALYTKPSATIQPTYSLYEAQEWIEFYWERDFLISPAL